MSKKDKLNIKESKGGTTISKSGDKVVLTKSETSNLYRHLANLDHVVTAKVSILNDLVPVIDEYTLLRDYIHLALNSANNLNRIFKASENRNKLTVSEKVDLTQHTATLDASLVEVNASISQLNHLLNSNITTVDLDDVYTDDGYTIESLYFIKEKLQNLLGTSDEE